MSLIQEALRRQQEEASRQPQGTGPAQPPTEGTPAGQPQVQPPAVRHMSLQQPKPPAIPPASEAQKAAENAGATAGGGKKKGEGKGLFMVMAILVLILLLAAGLALGGWKLYAAWRSGNSATEGSAEALATDTNAAALPDEAAEAPQENPSGGQEGVSSTGTPAVATTPALVAQTGDTSRPPAVSVSPAATATSVVHQPVKPSPVPKPKWPSLSLSGFIGRGSTGMAILNGQMTAVGESVSGVEVLSIERHAIKLRFMGETRVLNQGQTTDP
jgi:hypothetical protein